jgi:hypothetical protein
MTRKQELMIKLKTKYFNVIYWEEDASIINQIVSLIDSTYEEITIHFDLNTEESGFNFFLCPNVKEYIVQTGKREEDYQEWMVGNAEYKERRICILSPNAVTDRSFEDMLSVIRHEIVHIAFDQLGDADETNILIGEGIAVALANQVDKSALSLTDFPEAEKLMDEDYFYDNAGYDYSGVYMSYLLDIVGVETFKKIYTGEEDPTKFFINGFEEKALTGILGSNEQ